MTKKNPLIAAVEEGVRDLREGRQLRVTRKECTRYCDQCGDCLDCYSEDYCMHSEDGRHSG